LVNVIADLLQRGVQQNVFRNGVDPVELYISIAGLGFFYMSNRHTLSTIFDEDLSAPQRLAQRGEHIVDMLFAFLKRPDQVGCAKETS
jgi:TetR/AcrR family transcriptional regulator